ncbi:MAG: disulfide bond formation protein DsbA [Pseudonocardiales bacterium]|nr:disulfide bond formation protein DsbA [Pseudonocardiales bacterium]
MTSTEFATRHARGNPDAPATVVEFGDFECPYCAAAAPVLKALVDTSEGQIRLAFRHFPLFDVHPHALTAALAAEAAGAQGAFWPMHDILFIHQSRLGEPDLARYALKLGLDPTTVVGEPAQVFAPAVEADYLEGAELGVHGTPTLFINGDAYSGRVELNALRVAVARTLRGNGGIAPG